MTSVVRYLCSAPCPAASVLRDPASGLSNTTNRRPAPWRRGRPSGKDRERAMAKIRPLEDRVVIQQIEAEEKTAGGIVLPDTAKVKPQRGKVLAVGPGKLLDSGERAEIGVKEGDEVLFGKYSGTEIKILRESDILAKIL